VKKLAGFGIEAAAIHGNKSQAQRTRALSDFKDNRIQVLVATDIAARGIDIDQLAMVINHDLPNVPEDYVHRIGRTGRAGASGLAVSLVGEDENRLLRDIERLIRLKINRQDFDPQSLPKPLRQVETAPLQQARPARPASAGGHGHRNGQGGGNGGGTGGGNGGGRRSRRGGSPSAAQRSSGNGQQRHATGHQRGAGGQQRSGGGRQAAQRNLSGNR
jgi:ATP-dependent RNA helicase RhlE